jgi:hypothetical protein
MAGVVRAEFTRVPGVGIGIGGLYGGASGGNTDLGGVRLGVAEVDAKVTRGGFEGRLEGAMFTVNDAARVTETVRMADPSTDAVGSFGYGAYGELSYDVLRPFVQTDQQVRVFGRFEHLDPRATVPDGVADAGLSWSADYVTFGAAWLPLPQLAVKADGTLLLAGTALPGTSSRASLGLGWMF